MSLFNDRAARVATALLQIHATAKPDERRQAYEAYLRDDYADLMREILAAIPRPS
jgi:hypothetical protein